MRRWIPALCLVLLLAVPASPAMAAEDTQTALPVAVSTGQIDDTSLPSGGVEDVPAVDMAQVVELLTSINTYLTYLFGFGIVFIAVMFGKLVYRFFNMFF